MEQILTRQRYLTRGRVTQADWRPFTTLVRFDAVYLELMLVAVCSLTILPIAAG